MSLTLIALGVIIMGCAAAIHPLVRRRRRFIWICVFWVGFSISSSGIFIAEPTPTPVATDPGGTSQHSKADRLDMPRFTPRTERRA